MSSLAGRTLASYTLPFWRLAESRYAALSVFFLGERKRRESVAACGMRKLFLERFSFSETVDQDTKTRRRQEGPGLRRLLGPVRSPAGAAKVSEEFPILPPFLLTHQASRG